MVGTPNLNQQKGVLNNNSQWDADAHRVINVDSKGEKINDISIDNKIISTELLNDILIELKKTNFHLSILTDNDIKNTEVE